MSLWQEIAELHNLSDVNIYGKLKWKQNQYKKHKVNFTASLLDDMLCQS